MSDQQKPLYEFEFSLNVLNHLGRGLYRSFGTVVAEAISNSWDAEATEVRITLNQKNKKLIIEDNGKGMDEDDFRYKFLKIGYSRRDDPKNKPKTRNPLGRKGIGKLAMLSMSKKVVIVSKQKEADIVGALIDNDQLDEVIDRESPNDNRKYKLEDISIEDRSIRKEYISGTKIIFKDVKSRFNNTEILRKYMALQFNFMFSYGLSQEKFKVFVNDEEITEKDLKGLNDKTQFIWFFGEEHENLKNRYQNLQETATMEKNTFQFDGKDILVKGFIASVKNPNNLKLKGANEEFRTGVNLFSNGRMRQENLLETVSRARLVENYLYGEVHVDDFDLDENIDRFTSGREGIQDTDLMYEKFKKYLGELILLQIVRQWDDWRVKHHDDGNIDNNEKIKPYQRKIMESRNRRYKEWENAIDQTNIQAGQKETLKAEIRKLSYQNTEVYQDLFVLENIYREYLKILGFTSIDAIDIDGIEAYITRIKEVKKKSEDDTKDYITRIKEVKKKSEDDTKKGFIEFKIRKDEENDLLYCDLITLSIFIDYFHNQLKPLTFERLLRGPVQEIDKAKIISPIRNAIMHTNEITDEAFKSELITRIIDNIDRLNTKQEAKNAQNRKNKK